MAAFKVGDKVRFKDRSSSPYIVKETARLSDWPTSTDSKQIIRLVGDTIWRSSGLLELATPIEHTYRVLVKAPDEATARKKVADGEVEFVKEG